MIEDLLDRLSGHIAKLGHGSGVAVWHTHILLWKSRLDQFAHAGRIGSSQPGVSTEFQLERHRMNAQMEP